LVEVTGLFEDLVNVKAREATEGEVEYYHGKVSSRERPRGRDESLFTGGKIDRGSSEAPRVHARRW
jgi:hypothetical protein